MLKVNEYFGGSVKSIAVENEEGVATVGVMEIGEYEFGTSSKEIMTITGGTLKVMLPGENEWTTYSTAIALLKGRFERLVKMVADGGYRSELIRKTKTIFGWILEIVLRSDHSSQLS